jgi:hypothetical protein
MSRSEPDWMTMNRPIDPAPDAAPGPVDDVLPSLDGAAALPGPLVARDMAVVPA